MKTASQITEELNDGLTHARVEDFTLRLFRDKRFRYPTWGGCFESDCWAAELGDPRDTRPIWGQGETPGEAADALLRKLYPSPTTDEGGAA